MLFLERRWKQIVEVSSIYGDEDGIGDQREVPKEYWHDKKRVDEWIELAKERRKERD